MIHLEGVLLLGFQCFQVNTSAVYLRRPAYLIFLQIFVNGLKFHRNFILLCQST